MKTDKKISTLSDVYSRIIEKTVDSLKIHLNSIPRKNFKFNIAHELKTRWNVRVNLLIDSMNGSWSKFQDSCVEKDEISELNENQQISSRNFCLPSICSLSWDFYRHTQLNEVKTSNFKLWVWNCMVSGSLNHGNYLPIPSFLFFRKKRLCLKFVDRSEFLKNSKNKIKNVFKLTSLIKNKTEKIRKIDASFSSSSKISSKAIENPLDIVEKDFSEETSVEDLESNTCEKNNKNPIPNFLLASIEKVYRRNTKWTVILRDGILNINKKDFLFNFCKCEFFW